MSNESRWGLYIDLLMTVPNSQEGHICSANSHDARKGHVCSANSHEAWKGRVCWRRHISPTVTYAKKRQCFDAKM